MREAGLRSGDEAGAKSPFEIELDAWLAANPGGVGRFVARHGIRP